MTQDSEAEHGYQKFRKIWQRAPFPLGFFTEVNSQVIGRRFIATSLIFFLIGGLLALLIRLQLATSGNSFLSPEQYNQYFTMHGSTMMFLFIIPFLEGIALYVLPQMIGARDVAFSSSQRT